MSQGFAREALAQLIENLAGLIRSGDSLEGSFSYRLPIDGEEDANDTLMVDASIRTGNRDGQGSVVLIGNRP